MPKQDNESKATELSADDLDMAVGGAAAKLDFSKDEENVKGSSKAEQHRKHLAVSHEEKQKQL